MLFRSSPADFKKSLDVVGCFVVRERRFLLLHRHTHKKNGGLWGLPAGKQEPDESIEDAMVRELREETGIVTDVSRLERRDSMFVRHAGTDLIYHMFVLKMPSEPQIILSESEHQAFRWVTPEESFGLPLVHDQVECTKIVFGVE